MNTTKLIVVIILGMVLVQGNLFYRVYFVPEVLSDVAIQQMDRDAGAFPAVVMRTHTELADLVAIYSGVALIAVVLLLFWHEILIGIDYIHDGWINFKRTHRRANTKSKTDAEGEDDVEMAE